MLGEQKTGDCKYAQVIPCSWEYLLINLCEQQARDPPAWTDFNSAFVFLSPASAQVLLWASPRGWSDKN